MLTDDQIWHRPNSVSNSMGNLVLHLQGNLRQWIGSTLGGQPDNRLRQSEFEERGPIPRSELLQIWLILESDLQSIFSSISHADLMRTYTVQGFEENGVAILIHATEHFSYHVGQATYLTKMLTNLSTDYYAGQNLDVTAD